MEAFSDGVIAILITIMVLELRPPHEPTLAALRTLTPNFAAYALSFVFLGIYWNNHHHMLHATRRVTGPMLWANLHLLFWLSLVPFATAWVGDSHHESLPTAAYGMVLMLSGIAYYILERTIMAAEGASSTLAEAVGQETKGIISVLLYGLAIVLAFVYERVSDVIYLGVALMWLIPDRRIESTVRRREQNHV